MPPLHFDFETRELNACAELSSLLVNMNRTAQMAIAGPLRSAIWNWIELNQEEFNDALHYRRLEGAPERVFDLLYQLNSPDKAVIWPALTVLMCISPDRMKSEYNVNSIGMPIAPHSRKVRTKCRVLKSSV